MTPRPPTDLTSQSDRVIDTEEPPELADDIDLPPEPDLLSPAGRVARRDAAHARRLAWAGVASVGVSTVGIGLLHLVPPTQGLNPLSSTISEYALLPTGWIFDVAVLVLSLGSAAVLTGLILRRMVDWRSWGSVMMFVWCIGLVGLIVFPKQGFGADSSFAGRVHWTWTLVAFFSLPIGAALLCWRRRTGVAPGRWPRWAVGLSVVAAGWFAVLTIQTVLSAATSIEAWRLVGLVERALSATEMATVVVLALWLLSEDVQVQPD